MITEETLRAIIREELRATLPELLTRAELADFLKVDAHQIPKLIKAGLPYIPMGKERYRFLRSDVLAWLASQKRAA